MTLKGDFGRRNKRQQYSYYLLSVFSKKQGEEDNILCINTGAVARERQTK